MTGQTLVLSWNWTQATTETNLKLVKKATLSFYKNFCEFFCFGIYLSRFSNIGIYFDL